MIRTPSTGTNIPSDVQAGQRIRAQTTNDILAALRVNAKWHAAAGLSVPMYPDAPFRVFQYSRTSVWVVGGNWTRNGHKCTLAGQEVASLTAGPYYITLTLSHSDPTAHHAAIDPNTVAVSAAAALPSPDTYNTQLVIGYVECSGGYITDVQDWHRGGHIDDFCTFPDSADDGLVTVAGKSLDYDPYSALEQYGWHDASDAGSIADGDLITFQDVSETAKPQNYISFASLASAVVGTIEDGDLDGVIEDWFTGHAEHAALTDIAASTGTHTQVDHLTHWCNSAATNGEVAADATYARNYCASIGDPTPNIAIDLTNKQLWDISPHCSLDWSVKGCYASDGISGYEQRIMWDLCQLLKGGAVMLDWSADSGAQVDIGTTGTHKNLKVWGDVTIADTLDIDATDGLTVGGDAPYSSASEHHLSVPGGGYVALKFKFGIAFAY